MAENPASLRISGDHGSSTACHPVKKSRKALTRQPPVTPSPTPLPAPEPLPMMVLKAARKRRRPHLQYGHDGAFGSGLSLRLGGVSLSSSFSYSLCSSVTSGSGLVYRSPQLNLQPVFFCCFWKWSRSLSVASSYPVLFFCVWEWSCVPQSSVTACVLC